MKVSYNRGMVIGDWFLLICLIVSSILLTGDVGKYPYAPAVFVISLVWLVVRIFKYGLSYCFKIEYHESTTVQQSETAKQKEVKPYPMESGASNAALGAVDKCCEFAAYCEGLIPAGICSPEKLNGYIIASPQAIGFGFIWKTFYYSLDSLIEKEGYCIQGGGFSFSDNSGMVSYQRQILSDEDEYAAAYSYLMNKPVEEIIANFERIAENNFIGLNKHSASCKCTRDDAETREFVFVV